MCFRPIDVNLRPLYCQATPQLQYQVASITNLARGSATVDINKSDKVRRRHFGQWYDVETLEVIDEVIIERKFTVYIDRCVGKLEQLLTDVVILTGVDE